MALDPGELRTGNPPAGVSLRAATPDDVEEVIARHHELLSDEADAYDEHHGPGVVGGATIVERELIGPEGPTRHLTRGEPMKMRARIRFDVAVNSPQVHFTVLAEDRTIAYQMRSVINREHASFAPGEEAEIEVGFTPHLAGGSYRFVFAVSTVDGRAILHQDLNGMLIYVSPQYGSGGIADLDATITLDGKVLTDHPDLSI